MNPFILKKPMITEKTYALAMAQNAYTFEVNTTATKGQIKDAVQETFGVTVIRVHTIMSHGKSKRTGTRRGLYARTDRKKAIVKLKAGHKIEMFNLEEQMAAEPAKK